MSFKDRNPEKYYRLSSTERALWDAYEALEKQQADLFEAAGEFRESRPNEVKTDGAAEQGQAVYVFGRRVVLPPPTTFQQQLDRERGQAKTVYIWLLTASGWAYAGPLTVFKSLPQAELETLVGTRFGSGPAEHAIIEAASFQEAQHIFNSIDKYL